MDFITGGLVDVVTDSDKQKYIIETCHAGIQGDDLEDTAKYTGGHLGINKTQDKVSSQFYLPNIREDVMQYCKTCERCQRVNRCSLKKTNLELHSVPIPMKIWSQVGIDLMYLTETDDFEEGKRGYKYIITAQCYFSKYIEIGALKTKTKVDVSTWIYENIFCRYGITDIHISDRGKEFVYNVARELYRKCGVKHRITTPYHPQANGMIEHLNRTTGEMILKMM